MNKSEFRECFTCKHGRYKSDGKGRFEVHCNHPQNTSETNYKYATECRGDSLNEYTYWEPKCDSDEPNQNIKADAGKPQLTLVPRQILFDIAEVRDFGVKKYGDPDNWKKVEIQRYRDAALRHFMAYLDEPNGTDAESGLSHLAHLVCNIAFLCELEKVPFGGASNTADDEAQTIEAEPVKHGRWKAGVTCSKCGFIRQITRNGNLMVGRYCPNCGAIMDGDESE